ncbi:Nse4 C-terminal-domain-containing protein [Abortiporus biennis]|nr:Nse4 C-terminal-domain-containing protein [Abortiporus biennis]
MGKGSSSKEVKFGGPKIADDNMEYDPDQDFEVTRNIRSKYRHLRQDGIDPKETTVEAMIEQVDHADKLFNQVKGTAEALLDSDLLLKASEASAQKARAMKSGTGSFDIDDFVAKLVMFMGGAPNINLHEDDDDEDVMEPDDNTPLKWEKIGRKALAKSHRVPAIDFMLGPLSIEQKQRVAGKRQRLEVNKADEKKPQEITEDDITRSENETTKNVAQLEMILTDQEGPINLFRFIINPKDFGQSVENLFYLSFLIRDGKCALETNENGEPEIFSSEPPTEDDYLNGLKKQQLVMEFDMATWRRAIEVFNITESVIPQRPKAETRIGDKWYG